ncbi:YfdX family protein [Utexia brackfieldae]|uniref:YfdX family protein n=1 Tax=Utexia brackfieldae TaxID=3074108 RepID=UPI00370D2969
MKKILAITTLSLAIFAAGAQAAEVTATTTVKATTLSTQQVNKLTKSAIEGFEAMRNVQYARLAIFNGNIDDAIKATDQAAKLLAKDSTNWTDFLTMIKDPALKTDDNYAIIDVSIALSENFVATPEKEKAIAAANEKLKQGQQQEALEQLRLAGVSVNQTQYVIGLKQTNAAIAQAQQLLKSGKYYEANLILKSIQDSIITLSETLITAE